jgi:hypothetical protein
MWLKFIGPNGSVYQIKAYPTVANFEMHPQDLYCARDVSGRICRSIRVANDVRISLEFAGVTDQEL